MPMIKPLPTIQPKSPPTFVEFIRLMLDLAFKEKLNYISVSYRIAGDANVSTVTLAVDGSD